MSAVTLLELDEMARVPAEFMGMARRLRDELARDDIAGGPMIDKITANAYARWLRHPIPRQEVLAGLAREWREQLPKLGRVDLQITRERHGLTIKELRAGATDYCAINWDPGAHEPDITIMQLDLIIAPRKFTFEINNIAAASIHAVGRHFQRKIGEVDDKSVLRELHALAVWYLKLPEHRPGQQFEIDGWRGDMVDVGQRELVASVRTYLDADA